MTIDSIKIDGQFGNKQLINMIKVGITGQAGFIGSHLYNYLYLKEDLELVKFERSYFTSIRSLENFVEKCDVIVHLSAINRHSDQQIIYDTNVNLVQSLIKACENTQSKPHIIFSSSTQENKENLYGKSKQVGRKLLEEWASKYNSKTTGLVIPNVFGPFGKPNYNSVVATFCHKITHNEKPEILNDRIVRLIYVHELIDDIYSIIKEQKIGKVELAHTSEVKVSELLSILNEFKAQYMEQGRIPDINSPFRLALFNTFICYLPKDHYPFNFTKHTDNRGSFVEIVRANTSGQFSFSTTVPGITRGNHFHTRKAERFAVIKGSARIDWRKVDSDVVTSFTLHGDDPSFVDMPIWHTHSITNIGNEELITLFWINEPYNPDDPDTYFVNVYLEKEVTA